MSLKDRILEFLYKQVSENKIAMIRKGMVEDFEQFVLKELSDSELGKLASKMVEAESKAEAEAPKSNEKNS